MAFRVMITFSAGLVSYLAASLYHAPSAYGQDQHSSARKALPHKEQIAIEDITFSDVSRIKAAVQVVPAPPAVASPFKVNRTPTIKPLRIPAPRLKPEFNLAVPAYQTDASQPKGRAQSSSGVTPIERTAISAVEASGVIKTEGFAKNFTTVSILPPKQPLLSGDAFLQRERRLIQAANEPVAANKLALAVFYLDHGFAIEALEILSAMETGAEQDIDAHLVHNMQANAQILLGRYNDVLENQNLANIADARAIALYHVGAIDDALEIFGQDLDMSQARKDVAQLYQRTHLNSLIAAKRFDEADRYYNQYKLGSNGLLSDIQRVLTARRMIKDADITDQLLSSVREKISPLPERQKIGIEIDILNAQLSDGSIDLATAKGAVIALDLAWRGGENGRRLDMLCGAIAERSKDYPNAFAAYRRVVKNHPLSDDAALATKALQDLMEMLFAPDTDIPLLQSTNLFYENIDLLAPGAKGDRQIRQIVDRLAALDLLTEAQELLEHQVFQRLRGRERARIAVDLAQLYLDNRAPDEALRVIQSTRITGLNDGVIEQRRLIEGRALWKTGQHARALARLDYDTGTNDHTSAPTQMLLADILLDMGNSAAASSLLFAQAISHLSKPEITQGNELLIVRAVAVNAQHGHRANVDLIIDLASTRLAGRDVLPIIEVFGDSNRIAEFSTLYRNWVAKTSPGISEI